MQTISGVKQNLWRKQQSGLYAPKRMNFPIDGLVLYLPLWEPSQASLLNGTGIATGAPMTLVGPAAQTITVTQAGTFKIYLPKGATGTATAGTMAVTGSPVALVGGLNTITTTGAVGNFTIAVPTIISKDLNAHVCTVTGATWGSQGRTFDGNDYIALPNASFLPGTGDFTLEFWFKVPDSVGVSFCIFDSGSGIDYGNTTLYIDSNGKAYIELNDSSGVITKVSGSAYDDNLWHHLIIPFDRDGNAVIYVDGVADGTLDISAKTLTLSNTVLRRIGARLSGANYLTGTIGEARIYNRALSLAEFQHNYQATKWRYK